MGTQSQLREAPPSGDIDLQLLAEVKPVPVLPRGSADLFRAFSDPAMPFDELTQLLQRFPTIVARLLALANSPWSSPATPVAALDGAISRLGLGVVRSVSVALLVSCPFNTVRCRSFDIERYWCSALLSAEAAARLAQISGNMRTPPTVARTAGLISNLGLLWLADALPDLLDRVLSTTAESPWISVNDALLAEYGISYSDAGEVLGKAWQLPPQLVAALAYRRPTKTGTREYACATLTGLANDIVTDIYVGSDRVSSDAVLAKLAIDSCGYSRIRADLKALLPELKELSGTLFLSPPPD